MVIDHNNMLYVERWNKLKYGHKYNGAYYYSKEIVNNIIPEIETEYNWVTVNVMKSVDNSIVFIHDNMQPEYTYSYLRDYKNQVLVCGVPGTVEKVKGLSDKVIYLPLSIDVKGVEAYKKDERCSVCFAGRIDKYYTFIKNNLFEGVDILSGLPRENMLEKLSRYEACYCVGRLAIECKVLGVEVLTYDYRYPDPELWQVLDNKEAASILKYELRRKGG